jgi:TetR/AcrR family transcriptional repressor of nem operon
MLNAALYVIRAKGYSAARIEDICEAAGLTKGSFFHHFDSKEELALAAADYWIEGTGAFFASASFHSLADHPAIRDACNRSISEHAATLVPDIEEAIRERDMLPDWTAESLALYTQATLQGAFILAKAKHNREVAAATIDHLRRYLELLFNKRSGAALHRTKRVRRHMPSRRTR